MRVEHALTYCSILNGPNVICPFCNTLTHLIVGIIYFASLLASPLRFLKKNGLLCEPTLALKNCHGLTTVFDTHLL